MSFWAELKRRNVFRAGVAYLAFAWLAVQIASIVLPAFEFSSIALQALIVAFALGFPIVLVCAWLYELTPEGIKRTEDIASDAPAIRSARRLDFAIISALAFALVAVVVDQYVLEGGVRYDSIAVLPFRNLSGDPDQEYFADGMTDALIANLGKIEALSVISRTSVMGFKNTDLSLPEIAAALGATVIVEASAQRAGDRVQIIATLIDGAADRQLWAGTFEEDVTDILRLQSELARGIADEIEATVTPQEEARLAATRPVNPDAYDAYLRGTLYRQRLTPGDFDQAQAYFEQALEQDPQSALAYAGLAQTWAARVQTEVVPPSVGVPLVRGYAANAERIEPDLPATQEALSVVAYMEFQLADAEFHTRRAIKIEPSRAQAWFYLANLRVIAGDTDEAIGAIGEATRLDPLNPLYRGFQGIALMCAREYGESIAAYNRALEIVPNHPTIWLNLISSFHLAGRFDEAIDAQREWLSLTRNTAGIEALESGLADGGYADAMRRVAGVLAQQALATGTQPITVARHYARAGDTENVIEWWLRAFEQRDPNSLMVRAPEFEAIQGDPRVEAAIEPILTTL